MQTISPAWLYPIILIAGALQAWGPPMNHTLRVSLQNPWLASLVSFLPIVAVLACLVMCLPHPLPSEEGLAEMPWWAPLGGLVGAIAVIAGLLFVGTVVALIDPHVTAPVLARVQSPLMATPVATLEPFPTKKLVDVRVGDRKFCRSVMVELELM